MNNIVTHKICSRCKKDKDRSDFSPKKNTKDGLYYECKNCNAKYKKSKKAEKPEIYVNKIIEWQRKNVDKVRIYAMEYYKRHKEIVNEKRRTKRKLNPNPKERALAHFNPPRPRLSMIN